MKRGVLAVAVFLALAGPGAAQVIPDLPTLGASWLDVGYPRLYYTPENGFTVGLFYAQYRPLGFEDWNAPPQYRGSISFDWVLAASGTGRLGLEGKFPNFLPGWRFDVRLWWQREARQNYYGVGNETEFDSDNITDDQPYFYKQDRKRLYARGAVQRTVVGKLRALVGFHLERWQIDTLPGPSVYGNEVSAGLTPPPDQWIGEANVRLGLVYDSRDDEVAPTRGIHIEGIYSIADSGVAGDVSYDRVTISAAGYLPANEKLVVAGRLVGQSMTGDPPQGTYYMIEASEPAYGGLGGPMSHRAMRMDRFLGEDKLFGNFDARYRIVGERHVMAASLVGFLDVGRVFQPDQGDFELTLDGMSVGGGAGLILAFGRGGVIGWTLGYGPDALIVQTHLGWIF